MNAAIEEARRRLDEGGIRSVLSIDGRIAGRGRSRRVQRDSAILHAEMDWLENAGRLAAADYSRSVLLRPARVGLPDSGTATSHLRGIISSTRL